MEKMKELRTKWMELVRCCANEVHRDLVDGRLFSKITVADKKDITNEYYKTARSMGGWLTVNQYDAVYLCLPIIDGASLSLKLPEAVSKMFNPCLEIESSDIVTERMELSLLTELASHFFFLRVKSRHYAYFIKAFPKFTTVPMMFFLPKTGEEEENHA